MQVDALLNSVRGASPVVEWVASQFEELGYASWAHRIINTAGVGWAAPTLPASFSEQARAQAHVMLLGTACVFQPSEINAAPARQSALCSKFTSSAQGAPLSIFLWDICKYVHRFWPTKPTKARLHAGIIPWRCTRCSPVAGVLASGLCSIAAP